MRRCMHVQPVLLLLPTYYLDYDRRKFSSYGCGCFIFAKNLPKQLLVQGVVILKIWVYSSSFKLCEPSLNYEYSYSDL